MQAGEGTREVRLLLVALLLAGCASTQPELRMGEDVATPLSHALLCAQRPKLVVCGGPGE